MPLIIVIAHLGQFKVTLGDLLFGKRLKYFRALQDVVVGSAWLVIWEPNIHIVVHGPLRVIIPRNLLARILWYRSQFPITLVHDLLGRAARDVPNEQACGRSLWPSVSFWGATLLAARPKQKTAVPSMNIQESSSVRFIGRVAHVWPDPEQVEGY